ncbi:hypothetical protein PIB30_078167 [Stylosanthes scabra]|uniref:Ubiquitin-like protease family profile domain-containing protein n=1 Tax=Stylosanthes scabra TaxID=79078 RepID=A0ABU6SSP2_9FABA|nr:hypothetical protein [Stylosanthes scabra]
MQPPPNAEINPAAVIEPHAESSSLNAEINADAAAAPIDTLPPDASPALPENDAAAVNPPPQGVAAAIDHVMATPPDSGIEVVQATSAEEEYIRREMSESIANVVVETHVHKDVIGQQESVMEELTLRNWSSNSHPKDNEQVIKSLGSEFGSQSQSQPQSQPMEIYDIDDDEEEEDPYLIQKSISQEGPLLSDKNINKNEKLHQGVQKLESTEISQPQGPKFKTLEQGMEKEEDMSKRCCRWATESEGNNGYQFLFKFKTGKDYDAMRYHFVSMAEKSEVDLIIMQIMCILHNRENNEKFRDMIYCVPPLFLHDILKKYGHNYIDATTGLPYKITTMPNLDPLVQLFALVLYTQHWWLYVLDVKKRKFYALDSLNSTAPGSNVFDQMWVHAGARTLLPNMTRNVASHSLFAKYVPLPKQPNQFDCGVYVLKYMEIVNPRLLKKRNFTFLVWTEDELQQFKEEFVERILFDGDNFFRQQALKVSNPVARHQRPSAALQSPYVQLKTLAENFVQTAMQNRCLSLAFRSDLTSFEAARQSAIISLRPFIQNGLVVPAADVGLIPFDVLAPAFQYIS